MTPGNNRGTCRHRLNHNKAERLRPVDGEQQGKRVAEETALLLLIDLADELDEGRVEKRPDHLIEIILINLVHFGGNFEWEPGSFGNLDSPVRALLRGNPPQEGEVIAARWVVRAYTRW